jgi:hypothetical protein
VHSIPIIFLVSDSGSVLVWFFLFGLKWVLIRFVGSGFLVWSFVSYNFFEDF